jgi:phytoene dehydrogenase-like protein
LWKGELLESIWRKIEDLSVSLHLGTTVTQIDTEKKTNHG